jgi:hypothetical protein
MSLSTIFQLYRGGQFYWWRKPEYPERTTFVIHVCVCMVAQNYLFHANMCLIWWYTTTCVIGAYPLWCCEFESWSGRGVQHYDESFEYEFNTCTCTSKSSNQIILYWIHFSDWLSFKFECKNFTQMFFDMISSYSIKHLIPKYLLWYI